MKKSLTLVLFFLSVIVYAQVDSFLVGNNFFYSKGPGSWAISSTDDSISNSYGRLNIEYTHPVHDPCTSAHIGLMVRLNTPTTNNSQTKKKAHKKNKNQISSISYVDVDGYTCLLYKEQLPNRKCPVPNYYSMYIYKINDTLELVTAMISSLNWKEEKMMEDSLLRYTERTIKLNEKNIRKLNPNFSSPKVDSLLINGHYLKFPIIADWTRIKHFPKDQSIPEASAIGVANEKSSECEPIHVLISANKQGSALIIGNFNPLEFEQMPHIKLDIPSGKYSGFYTGTDSIVTTEANEEKRYFLSEENYIYQVPGCNNEKHFMYVKTYSIIFERNSKEFEINFKLTASYNSPVDILQYDEYFKVFFSYVRNSNNLEELCK